MDKELDNVNQTIKKINQLPNGANAREQIDDFDDDFPGFLELTDIMSFEELPGTISGLDESRRQRSTDGVPRLLKNLPAMPTISVKLQDKVNETTELIEMANKKWSDLILTRLAVYNPSASDSFYNWIPTDPTYKSSTPPSAEQRLGRKMTITKAQALAGLNVYQEFLKEQQKNLSTLVQFAGDLEKFKQGLRMDVAKILGGVNSIIQDETKPVEEERSRLLTEVIGLTTQKDSLALGLFTWLLGAFIVSLLGLHLIMMLLGRQTAGIIFSSNSLLNIFTVFVLVSSIVILAMAGKLDEKELATLIAAISGYVLGQLGGRRFADNLSPAGGAGSGATSGRSGGGGGAEG